MSSRNLIRDVLYWILPAGVFEVLKGFNYGTIKYCLKNGMSVFRQNKRFKNLYYGKRCFIMCNGPSINEQDLIPLKDEVVFSVSNGYKYKDYKAINPKYHCIPQITYGKMTKEDTIAWFKEMDANLGEAELFLNYTEHKLVNDNKLFRNRKVSYLCLGRPFYRGETKIIDITHIIPAVQTVPIMCLMIAMYMGFKEIYLLGTEHDAFRTGEYKYFFKEPSLGDKNKIMSADGKILYPVYDVLKNCINLRDQYRYLKKIAEHNGIQILNATKGGALEDFERVDIEDIFIDK